MQEGFNEEVIREELVRAVNIADKKGQTPLHIIAVRYHGAECVKYLISFGANTEALDMHGKTPLYYAISNNSTKEKRGYNKRLN
ncbi:MAG: ankyrin repeat domain-containing protein [Rickettsiales endosymbiont of Dermacentor nuttalli]